MHLHFLDTYKHGSSPIHQLDARIKLVFVILFIICTAMTPVAAWPVYIFLYTLILSTEILSELGTGFYFKRALLALPFILAALPIIFTYPSDSFVNLPVGSGIIKISLNGSERFMSIAFKSWISVQAAVILASCTEFPDLLAAMRAIGIPRLLVSIFRMMWRYLFVLADEALRLLRARQARSSQSDRPNLKVGGSMVWRARITGGMAGSLFLRAFERSDRIYNAMLARGYDGEVRSHPLPNLSKGDRLVLLAGILLLSLLLLFSKLFWN